MTRSKPGAQQKMFDLKLNKKRAAVLLRCLSYGEAAISEEEDKNGIGQTIEEEIHWMRKSVSTKLAEGIIKNRG